MGRPRARLRARFAELVYRLRTEARSPREQAVSIGYGVFVGCTPFWGFHLLMVIVGARLLGLSRVTAYLAANIGNPLTLPFLVFAEIQTGAFLRRGEVYPFSVRALEKMHAWDFAAELLLGSVVVGALLGLVLGLAAWLVAPKSERIRQRRLVVERAAYPYLSTGLAQWEFARGKLAHDPVFLHVVARDLLPRTGTLLDLGCGRGLLFALLRSFEDPGFEEASRAHARPELRMYGIEARRQTAAVARRVLAPRARIVLGDVARARLPRASAAVIFDVLHYLPVEKQAAVLDRVAAALEEGGVLLLREADADAGTGFRLTQWAERVRAWGRGHFKARFHFLPARVLRAMLEERGFSVEVEPMGSGTPFANALFVATRVKADAGEALRVR